MKKVLLIPCIVLFILVSAAVLDMGMVALAPQYSTAHAGWGKKAAKIVKKSRDAARAGWSKTKSTSATVKKNMKREYKDYKQEKERYKRKGEW